MNRSLLAAPAVALLLIAGTAGVASAQSPTDIEVDICAAVDIAGVNAVLAAAADADLPAGLTGLTDAVNPDRLDPNTTLAQVRDAVGCSDETTTPEPTNPETPGPEIPAPTTTEAPPAADPVQEAKDAIAALTCAPGLESGAAFGRLQDQYQSIMVGLADTVTAEQSGALADTYGARLEALNFCFPQGATPPPNVTQSPADRSDEDTLGGSGDSNSGVVDSIPNGAIDTGYVAA